MTTYEHPFEVRWNDVDPNRHARNTAYLEFASHTRFAYLAAGGFDTDRFVSLQIGPVVFRDEVVYRRELRLHDRVTVTWRMAGLSDDGARWRLHHDVVRRDGVTAATIRSDGGWFDLTTRELVSPPDDLAALLAGLTRTDDFEVLPSARAGG